MDNPNTLTGIEVEYCDALEALEQIEARYLAAGGLWGVLDFIQTF